MTNDENDSHPWVVLSYLVALYAFQRLCRFTAGFYRLWKAGGNIFLLTAMLDQQKITVIPSARSARTAFRNLSNVTAFPSNTHSHGVLAANRARAVSMMQAYALSLGRRLFMLQKSGRDVESGIAGSRQYYWMKDTDVEACDDTPDSGDVIGMVDTDYYMDMDTYLATVDCPVIIYTMTPTRAAEANEDGLSFTFDAQDTLQATVSGGAKYSHQLWNYGVDVFTSLHETWLPWNQIITSFDVDRRTIAPHFSLIALTPRHRWVGWTVYLARLLSASTLSRVQLTEGKWVMMYVQTQKEHLVSLAKVGSRVAVTLPIETFEGLLAKVKVSKIPITIGVCENNTTAHGCTNSQASILCEYLLDTLPVPKLRVYPVEYSVKRFQWGRYEPDAKPSLIGFMAPIVNNAISPDPTLGNEQRCVDKRIRELAQDELPLTPDIVQYTTEFVGLVVPESMRHTLTPVEEDIVYERQSRPTQRRLLAEAGLLCWQGLRRVVKAFMKKEAYGKFTDPRNISTINPKDKLEYSRFVYSVAETLKKTKWYAFGQTPKMVAERVAEICRSAGFVIPSDYSRLDGTISNLCRFLEDALFKRAFAPHYHNVLDMLMKTQYNLRGVGTFGTRYLTGWSRLSGSPETSVCNTLVTAFVAYMAFRRQGLSPAEAYAKLGIYGGDDGLTPDIDEVVFSESAEKMGLRLTVEKVCRGKPGVHFLARLYTPDVWVGDDNSMCDLWRQLSKFHTCLVDGVLNAEKKLWEKSYSFYLTDKNTPIIGPFVTRVFAIGCELGIVPVDPEKQDRAIASYASIAPEDEQYPNRPHEWFDTYIFEKFPNFDPQAWNTWLTSCTTLTQLLFPVCIHDCQMLSAEDLPPVGVFVNGEARVETTAQVAEAAPVVAAAVVVEAERPVAQSSKTKPKVQPPKRKAAPSVTPPVGVPPLCTASPAPPVPSATSLTVAPLCPDRKSVV